MNCATVFRYNHIILSLDMTNKVNTKNEKHFERTLQNKIHKITTQTNKTTPDKHKITTVKLKFGIFPQRNTCLLDIVIGD